MFLCCFFYTSMLKLQIIMKVREVLQDNNFEDILSSITKLTIYYFLISKLKYKNLNSFSQLLFLFSGDISLNLAAFIKIHYNSNEWNVFKNKDLHFVHLNINSLLSKIEEICFVYNFVIYSKRPFIKDVRTEGRRDVHFS